MIQRIQTLYLIISIILIIITGCLPIAHIVTIDSESTLVWFQFIHEVAPEQNKIVWGGLVFGLINILYAVYVIISYSNRPKQAKMCNLLCSLELVYLITIVTYAYVHSKSVNGALDFSLVALLPFIAMLFTILAKRAIIKDERLVRSADRLR